MNSQFCPFAPVGARSASSMHFNTTASSTGSGRTRRTARWVIIASSSGMLRRASASAAVGMAADASELKDSEFGMSVMSPRLQRCGAGDLRPTFATVCFRRTSAAAAGNHAFGLSPLRVAGGTTLAGFGRPQWRLFLSDPRGGEALHFVDLFGQLAADVALDFAADQWNVHLNCRDEPQARAVLRWC